MNGTMNATPMETNQTKWEKGVWNSKTDKLTRYEKCTHCNEMVLDNWFMRHVTKCLAVNPNREALLEQAERQHHDFKIDLLERTKTKLDAAVEPKQMALDEQLVKPTQADQITINAFQKYTFKFGDLIEAVVTDIDKYNIVHVNMINGNPEKKGMIKSTKVRTGIVKDMHEHFRIGDKIRAEVNECRVDGKLWLSTKRFPVPTYPLVGGIYMPIGAVTPAPAMSAIAEKLLPLKEQIIVQPKLAPAPTVQIEDKHFEEVLTFVKSKIGIVSPEAKLKIKTMLDSKGMFTFMMALAKVADFQMDVGLMFAAEIEKKMGNHP